MEYKVGDKVVCISNAATLVYFKDKTLTIMKKVTENKPYGYLCREDTSTGYNEVLLYEHEVALLSVDNKACECGCSVLYGKDWPGHLHSDYCPLYTKENV